VTSKRRAPLLIRVILTQYPPLVEEKQTEKKQAANANFANRTTKALKSLRHFWG
jgi:hypothetical protein